MSKERCMGIIEQEMHGARKETSKGETYNLYGSSAMTVAARALEEHGTFIMVTQKGPQRLNCV